MAILQSINMITFYLQRNGSHTRLPNGRQCMHLGVGVILMHQKWYSTASNYHILSKFVLKCTLDITYCDQVCYTSIPLHVIKFEEKYQNHC